MTVINQICYIVVIACVAVAGMLLIDRQELTLAPLMIGPLERLNLQQSDDGRHGSHDLVPTHAA